MDIDMHIKAVHRHGVALGDAASAAGLDAPVPTCPEWQVRHLLAHIGRVHRWAASFVSTGRTDPPGGDSELAVAPDDDGLAGWYRDGLDALVQTLSAAPPDVECWSFLPAPSPLAFWARRQAHETAIHRADAEAAAGRTCTYDTAFAIDGIDELLLGFYARKRGRLVADPPVTIGIRLTDGAPDDAWSVAINADGRLVDRGRAHGDCVVTGSASDVYLMLWNRRDTGALDITGDQRALDVWRDKATVTWS